MRLVDAVSHQEIDFVDAALDGIPEDDPQKWRVRETANRFELAYQGGGVQEPPLRVDTTTIQEFYLHTRELPNRIMSFYAKFKKDAPANTSHKSTDLSDINSEVVITPRALPLFDPGEYLFEPVRVSGGGNPTPIPPPENEGDDPFDLHLRTIDYWTLSYRPATFETVRFVPVVEGGDAANKTSMILWESEQLAETYFSWTGFIFDDPQVDGDVKIIQVDKDVNRDRPKLTECRR